MLLPVILPIAIVVCLLVAVELGYRFGKHRMRAFPAEKKIETGSIQGAMLGILGLLLGFSFAGAAGRFIERQDLISKEANAIGTAYRRAELLNQPHADQLKAALYDYLDHRIQLSRTLRTALTTQQVAEIAAHHDRIWNAARVGVDDKPVTTNMVVSVVNEVLDLHDYRVAAGRKHLPLLVLTLLGLCSVLTLAVMGYASALGRHRNTLMISVIAFLIAATLWTTIDLDWSRMGIIRVSDLALEELLQSLKRPPTP